MTEPKLTEAQRLANEVSKRLIDEGKLIEAGWAAFRMLVVPPNAPDQQVEFLRVAFMAGAQHLWGSVFGVLDPGDEPTERDMRRMDLIEREMRAILDMLKLRVERAKGSA